MREDNVIRPRHILDASPIDMNNALEFQQPICIKNLKLGNGMDLEVWDGSRSQAGDRCLVMAIFRLTIPVIDQLLSGSRTSTEISEIRSLVGEQLVFKKRLERNFVDKNEKEEILNQMVQSDLEGALKYLSKPAFSRNYILKQYDEAVQKRSWYRDPK